MMRKHEAVLSSSCSLRNLGLISVFMFLAGNATFKYCLSQRKQNCYKMKWQSFILHMYVVYLWGSIQTCEYHLEF